MRKKTIEKFSTETHNLLVELEEKAIKHNAENQRKLIDLYSPYSATVNDLITSYDELCLYINLQLKEAYVTRKALIRQVDMNLWISHEQKTNMQLIKEGCSPYAYDAEDGIIQLHHIGQGYNAVLAELTESEHKLCGNSRILHNLNISSWRQDEQKEKDFTKEKIKYWKKRLNNTYEILQEKEVKLLEEQITTNKETLSNEIVSAIEILMSECSIADLNFIKDLAVSYSLVRQIGVNSITEFLNTRKDVKISCTHCGSNLYKSSGSYVANGEKIKRYMCKKCGKTFTTMKNSMISESNLSFIDWLKLIDCLSNGYSIEKTAVICQITKKSAINNRFKIFCALKNLDDKVKLRGKIVIDETFFELSFKGNHSVELENRLPREVHKRGNESHVKGTGKNKISLICAIDDSGNSIARVTGLGTATAEKIKNVLSDAIDKKYVECIYSDGSSAIRKYALEENLPIKQCANLFKRIRNKEKLAGHEYKIGRYLQIINSYHRRLHDYLRGSSMPSSKYISGYAYFFAWKERNKHKPLKEMYEELLEAMLFPNTYIPNEEILNGSYLPDPYRIEANKNKPSFKNIKKAKVMCDLYEKGWTLKAIGKKFKISTAAVAKTITKARSIGMLQQTVREKNKEQQHTEKATPKKTTIPSHYVEIYEAKNTWCGTVKDFYLEMRKKHNLSERTIRNIVCLMKRVIKLREQFSFLPIHSYKSIKEIYQEIYDKYLVLNRTYNKVQTAEILAREYNYEAPNIHRIAKIMQSPETYFAKGKRLSPNETLNRDRALFIDYLRWTGSTKEFYRYAYEKYGISKNYVCEIIRCVLFADPNRNNMIG